MKHLKLKYLTSVLALLYTGLSYADVTPFPFYPRANIYGGTGSDSYGRLDILAPVFGSSDGIIYADLDGQRGSNSDGYISFGLGGRDATSDDFMWGGYLFADHITSNMNNISNNWTVLNPGIEYMTNIWDGRMNFYIPTATQKTIKTNLLGDQVGQSSAISFSGHNEYSGLFDDVQEIGPGADLDFGLTIQQWNRFRIHGGGYYFNPKDTDKVQGGEIGAELPINNYFAVEAIDTYDNVQNNKAMISVRVTFGGADKSQTPTVQDRLLDPVYHNFAGAASSTIVPIGSQIVDTGQTALVSSNVWFFTAGSGSAFNNSNGLQNCTYENPCNGSSFNQVNVNNINTIAPGADLFFTPGSYTINSFTLPNGQSMFGRNGDFTLPATQGNQPIFVGGISPLGNNTLDSFTLQNNGSQAQGINIQNVNNVQMNNLVIGQPNSSQGYTTGIILSNANNIMLTNSTVNAFSSNAILAAIGVNTTNSNAELDSNTFNINATNGTASVSAIGVINQGIGGVLNINNNTFTISGTSVLPAPTSGITTYGVENTGSGSITLNSNTFQISSTNTAAGSGDKSVGIYNVDGGSITASNNLFSLAITMASGPLNNNMYAIYNTSTGTITANNNQFSLNAPSSVNAYGIYNSFSSGSVVANNNVFNFTGSSVNTCTHGTNITGTGNIYNITC